MSGDRTVMRRAFDALLPKGSVWEVAPEGEQDKYYDSLAEDLEIGREKVAAIAATRDPAKTDILSDLEIDFGIIPNDDITDANRREYLGEVKGDQGYIPSWKRLENTLRGAGYAVRVYPNDPKVDPASILQTIPLATVGDDESTIGNPDCRIGYYGGELLVNGDSVVSQEKDYLSTVCSDDSGETTVCDDVETTEPSDRGSTIGEFNGMIRELYSYPNPPESRWQFVYFIAASRAYGQQFLDWNMEFSTITKWTAGVGSLIEKTYDNKTSGIRAIEVKRGPSPAPPVGAYAQALPLEDEIIGAATVTVEVAAVSSGRKAGLMVADKDGVWDTLGIVWLALSATGTLEYTAVNGVSNARLYLGGSPAIGDVAIFDDLKIDAAAFTYANISQLEEYRFKKLCLRYKPVRAWLGLLINWTPYSPSPGAAEEDDMTYRFQETTLSGTLTIVDAETAVHIILKGTATGFTISMDDAQNFTVDRLYRFTNQTTQNIAVQNYDGSITDTLLPGNVLQATLSDRTVPEGDWLFVQHIAGGGS